MSKRLNKDKDLPEVAGACKADNDAIVALWAAMNNLLF